MTHDPISDAKTWEWEYCAPPPYPLKGTLYENYKIPPDLTELSLADAQWVCFRSQTIPQISKRIPLGRRIEQGYVFGKQVFSSVSAGLHELGLSPPRINRIEQEINSGVWQTRDDKPPETTSLLKKYFRTQYRRASEEEQELFVCNAMQRYPLMAVLFKNGSTIALGCGFYAKIGRSGSRQMFQKAVVCELLFTVPGTAAEDALTAHAIFEAHSLSLSDTDVLLIEAASSATARLCKRYGYQPLFNYSVHELNVRNPLTVPVVPHC